MYYNMTCCLKIKDVVANIYKIHSYPLQVYFMVLDLLKEILNSVLKENMCTSMHMYTYYI